MSSTPASPAALTFIPLEREQPSAIAHLFRAAFSDADGPEEGQRVGALVEDLARDLSATDQALGKAEILGFGASRDHDLIGAIFFSRLHFNESTPVMLLAPVAVSTAHQNQGIGQALIRHGLEALRQTGIRLVLTYGNPAFYGKLGFEPLAVEQIQAPLPLSMPQGWLGFPLTGEGWPILSGQPRCVAALDDPTIW
jgi:putative acetyltransferase